MWGEGRKHAHTPEKESQIDCSESGDVGSHGEHLRRETSNRKEGKEEASDDDATSPHESRGEIRSSIERDLSRERGRTPQGSEKGSGRLVAIWKRRRAISTIRSSQESMIADRRASDIFLTSPMRYRNVRITDLPSRLRQTSPRSTDPPLTLK